MRIIAERASSEKPALIHVAKRKMRTNITEEEEPNG
jgi:hypothetical protein